MGGEGERRKEELLELCAGWMLAVLCACGHMDTAVWGRSVSFIDTERVSYVSQHDRYCW